jgi:hypothetical protein
MVFAQFTNVQSIHSAFYKWKTMNDNEKQFIPALAIENEFFVVHLSILVQCKTKGAVRVVCTLLHIWPLSTVLLSTKEWGHLAKAPSTVGCSPD